MRKSPSRRAFEWLCSFPAIFLYTIFLVYPTISIFLNSGYRWGGLSGKKSFVGFENFQKLAADPKFIRAFQNTVFLMVLVTIVTMACAIIFAAILTGERIRGQNFFRILFYIPNILSIAVVAAIFAAVYGMDDGLLNGFFRLFHGETWQNTPFLGQGLVVDSIAFAMIWQAVGYYMVMYMSSMAQIPQQLYEASAIDGAGRVRQFFDVTLPLSWETIRTTLTFYVISNINIAFQIVRVLTGGGPDGASATLLNYLYDQAYDNSSYGYGLAIGVVVFLFSFGLTAIINRITKRDVVQY
ncbi:MAG: sugar ABC transporter permease [Ndongobacter sp.]|nr:sugar ABC transporter permease [Ndongobacter sp.]